MATFPQTFHISDATPADFDAIRKLFCNERTQYFGKLQRKIETADMFFKNYITYRLLIRISENNPNVIAYAEANISPDIAALSQDSWPNWLKYHYCPQLRLSLSNTLFFNTFVYNNYHKKHLIRQLLSEIFHRENKLRYAIVVQNPQNVDKTKKAPPDYTCLESFATSFYPLCFSAISCSNTQSIHVICRDDIIAKSSYRTAFPEDNDFIVDLMDLESPQISKEFGKFYIAEELLAENSKSLIIVAEISQQPAGFIWLKENPDILFLVENYNLDLFGDLLEFKSKNTFAEKQLVVRTASRCPINKLFTIPDITTILETLDNDEVTDDNAENASLLSIISGDATGNFGTNECLRREVFFKKMERFVSKLKNQDYYRQLHKKRLSIFYSLPENSSSTEIKWHSNAFTLEMFGLQHSHDKRRLFHYLLTTFAAFPEKDYCLLSVSRKQKVTTALLEMLKYFIPVTPRPDCIIDEDLYITYRSAIYGDLCLYPIQVNDLPDIQRLYRKAPHKPKTNTESTRHSENLLNQPPHGSLKTDNQDPFQYELQMVISILENIFNHPYSQYKCFVIKCGDATKTKYENATVGFVILRPFASSWKLEKHFLLPKAKLSASLNEAEIMILKLHPFFHHQADVIFRELARQSYTSCYYFQQIKYPNLSNDLLKRMQPLEPRRVKKLWFGKFSKPQTDPNPTSEDDFRMHQIDFCHDSYDAFRNNLCQSTYFGYIKNIVILGFTDICKAFLRLLIFGWHNVINLQSTYNCLPNLNVTIICSPGVKEAEYDNSFKCETCKTNEECWINDHNSDSFIQDVTKRMDVRNWVKFISGDVKEIESDNHTIKLTSDCEIHYETLLLMCSTEYGIPSNIINSKKTPSNYIQINNRFDKILFYHRLRLLNRNLSSDLKRSIVVYGTHIRAFEFINFLLTHGVDGANVVLVMPYQSNYGQKGLLLNDSAMDAAIEKILMKMLEDLNVKIYELMNLLAFNYYKDDDNIESVTFKSFQGDKEMTLECDFFVSYLETYMDETLLKVLNASKLDVTDSCILVDENFQTSNDSVYAIGNFIKHRVEPNHQYRFVSPQEAAEKLITALQLNQNPNQEPVIEKKFSKPIYFQAQLPMDYNFVKITMPKRYLANHLNNEYGSPMTTYLDEEFTRVRLNEHDIVEEIVAVTKKVKKANYDFLKFFCGRHELLLNNLRSRWYLGYIENFLDFFQEAWVELLMNEHFEELQESNKMLIMPTAKKVLKLNTDRKSRNMIMNGYCQHLGLTDKLKVEYLQFIRKHREEFQTQLALPEDFPQKQDLD